MKWILNAAVIPVDGLYRRRTITREAAVEWLRNYGAAAISAVGYPATSAHIREISGVEVSLSRDMTTMEPGDEALVVKLRYRLQDPASKGRWTPGQDDWEYLIIVREE